MTLPSPAALRRVLVPLAIVAVLGAGVTLIAPTVKGQPVSSPGTGTVSTTGFPSGAGVPGIFTDRCGYSHSAADDPIAMPGHAGMAMQHDFFGNTATTASSTAATLVGGSTTCSTGADASAYWTPVLYQDGRALKPGPALIYWRKAPKDTGAVHTIPAGLQMIAGNKSGTTPQPLDVVRWTCTGNGADRRPTAGPHDCAAGHRLRLVMEFPSCWDGRTLAGASQTNVVHPRGGACPADHAVRIPEVVFHVTYPTARADGLTLSMTPDRQGSTDTAHVDFVNGWNQAILDRDVAACTAAATRCGPVRGAAATPVRPNPRRLARDQRDQTGQTSKRTMKQARQQARQQIGQQVAQGPQATGRR